MSYVPFMFIGDLMQEIVDFNDSCPIGTEVILTLDDGSTFETVTRSEAWLLGSLTPVVLLKGKTGCYLLSRVKPKKEKSNGSV